MVNLGCSFFRFLLSIAHASRPATAVFLGNQAQWNAQNHSSQNA